MSENTSQPSPALSVDDFIALNDEIASLLKAGVPLDVGLSGFANSVSGRLSTISAQVADAVGRGQSLEDAVESAQSQMPVAYRAILEAGAEAGRLPQAVESLADHARRLQEARRQITLAMIYPTIVILVAWCLFWVFVRFVAPTSLRLSQHAADPPAGWMIVTEKIAEVLKYVGPIPPVLLVGFLVWLALPNRGASRRATIDFRGIRWLPGSGQARRAWNLSSFTDISAKLLEHGVPEHRALQLAAKTTNDPALMADVQSISDALRNGEPAAARIDAARSLPPFLKWMWKVAESQSAMVPTFQNLSDHYQCRADRAIARIQLLFPIAMTVFVAGGIVAMYGIAIFKPITDLMFDFSHDTL